MTDDERKMEVFRQHRETSQKYIYFALTINGAAIAYCIGLKIPDPVSWVYLFQLVAIVSWGFSFYLGCRYIFKILNVNALNNLLLGSKTPDQVAKTENAIRKVNKKSSKLFNWMFRFLMFGFAFFIIWHCSNIPFCQMFQ